MSSPEFPNTPPPLVGGTSPWGRIEAVEVIAPGIAFVSTPSHGGYLLSRERVAAMPDVLKFTPDHRAGIFEEDCSAPLVVLAFPDAGWQLGAEAHARRFVARLAAYRSSTWKHEPWAAVSAVYPEFSDSEAERRMAYRDSGLALAEEALNVAKVVRP